MGILIARRAAPKVAGPVARPSKEKKPAPAAPRGPKASASKASTVKTGAAQPGTGKPTKVPFPKKNQMPTEGEFLARLPAAVGKRFDAVRTFLKKQEGVSEDLFFYGPKTGWAYRFLRGRHSLATIMIHDERLVGIVALDADAAAAVDFASLSDVATRARKLAHGSPSLMWLDLPLDGAGAADFKALLKAKLKALPASDDAVAPPPLLPAAKGRPRA
jgi:hypothetical protein